MTIEIILNGAVLECPDKLNIDELMSHLGVDSRSVAIERNLELVPKSNWANTRIKSGDKIELIQFVGGG